MKIPAGRSPEERYAFSGAWTKLAGKDTNPKDAISGSKVPLDLVPAATMAYASLAHLNGALKYGPWNWRTAGVRASVYIAAMKRHIERWEHGEEDDEDGVPHLSSLLADVGIVLDARECGKLNDDRPPHQDVGAMLARLEPVVVALREKHVT